MPELLEVFELLVSLKVLLLLALEVFVALVRFEAQRGRAAIIEPELQVPKPVLHTTCRAHLCRAWLRCTQRWPGCPESAAT